MCVSLSGQLPLSRRSRARVPLPLEHLNERSALFAPRRKGRKKKTPDVATAAVCFPSLRRLCCCRYCCRCWCWCCFRPPARPFVRSSVRQSGRPSPLSFFGVGKSRQRLPVPSAVFVRVTGRWRAALSSSALRRCLGGSVADLPPCGSSRRQVVRGWVGGWVAAERAVVCAALPPGSSGGKTRRSSLVHSFNCGVVTSQKGGLGGRRRGVK